MAIFNLASPPKLLTLYLILEVVTSGFPPAFVKLLAASNILDMTLHCPKPLSTITLRKESQCSRLPMERVTSRGS